MRGPASMHTYFGDQIWTKVDKQVTRSTNP